MAYNHFTATGIVFNLDDTILMIYHRQLKVWLPPGGHIEENELPDDAVLREILEETGVVAKIVSNKRMLCLSNDNNCRELELPFTILLEDIENDGKHNHIDMVYVCLAINNELKPNKTEVDGIGWFTFDEINYMKTYSNVKEAIFKAIEYMKEINSKV